MFLSARLKKVLIVGSLIFVTSMLLIAPPASTADTNSTSPSPEQLQIITSQIIKGQSQDIPVPKKDFMLSLINKLYAQGYDPFAVLNEKYSDLYFPDSYVDQFGISVSDLLNSLNNIPTTVADKIDDSTYQSTVQSVYAEFAKANTIDPSKLVDVSSCTPGTPIKECSNPKGPAHTYCEWTATGNKESDCKVDACNNGKNPPNCTDELPLIQPLVDAIADIGKCQVGTPVRSVDDALGIGHTFCEWQADKNKESKIVYESCKNGQAPPDCKEPVTDIASCEPGTPIKACPDPSGKGAGHTYCEWHETGNTESACKIEVCQNGGTPPACQAEKPYITFIRIGVKTFELSKDTDINQLEEFNLTLPGTLGQEDHLNVQVVVCYSDNTCAESGLGFHYNPPKTVTAACAVDSHGNRDSANQGCTSKYTGQYSICRDNPDSDTDEVGCTIPTCTPGYRDPSTKACAGSCTYNVSTCNDDGRGWHNEQEHNCELAPAECNTEPQNDRTPNGDSRSKQVVSNVDNGDGTHTVTYSDGSTQEIRFGDELPVVGKCGDKDRQVVVRVSGANETPDVHCPDQGQSCVNFTNDASQADAKCE